MRSDTSPHCPHLRHCQRPNKHYIKTSEKWKTFNMVGQIWLQQEFKNKSQNVKFKIGDHEIKMKNLLNQRMNL